MLKRIPLLLVSGFGILIAALILRGGWHSHSHGPDCGDNCIANLMQIDPASIKVGVSKEGFRAESLPMPKGWPLRVVLRREDR